MEKGYDKLTDQLKSITKFETFNTIRKMIMIKDKRKN